jgi:shikimate kinase
MKLTLIGMSNVGKTHWAKKLEEKGFLRLSCDDYIEDKLEKELRKNRYSGIHDVSRWMGQPYDKQYKQSTKVYLHFEIESLKEFIHVVRNQSRDFVIETTGSVIYTGVDMLRQLKEQTKIVYLDTPASVQEEMYRSYIQNPKPVLWGNMFQKRDNEDNNEALKRCYPKMLSFRTKEYKRLADIQLDYFTLRERNFTTDRFINMILK